MIYKGIDYEWCWLQLEFTDYCNYSCQFCLSGNPFPQIQLPTPHLIWQENEEKEITFRCKDKNFPQLYLVGEFNYWGLNQGTLQKPLTQNSLMKKRGDFWETTLKLKTGKYKFAFVAEKDGKFEWHLSDEYPIAKDKYQGLTVHYLEVGKPGKLKRGFLEKELLLKILHELSTRNLTLAEFVPFWFGETLLHPQMENFIELVVKSKIFKRISLHTNASLLNKEKAKFFLKIAHQLPEGLKISFSLDSIIPEKYAKIRRGGSLEEVLKNITYFLKQSKREKKILSTIQFIVQEDNFQEGEDYFNFWKNFLEKEKIDYKVYFSFDYEKELGKTPVIIFFRPLDYTSETRCEKDQLHQQFREKILKLIAPPKNLEKKDSPTSSKNFDSSSHYICSSPWRSLFIQWNGDVSVCCADTLGNLQVGNFYQHSLDYIWHEGEKIKKLRQNHLEKNFTETFLRCAFCPQWQVPSLTQYEKEIYLNWLKEQKK